MDFMIFVLSFGIIRSEHGEEQGYVCVCMCIRYYSCCGDLDPVSMRKLLNLRLMTWFKVSVRLRF